MDLELIKKIQNIANNSGGYLTIDLFNENRGDLPTWKTLKAKLRGIGFEEVLKNCDVLTQEEFGIKENRIKAISNMKLVNLEFGELTKTLYDSQKLVPNSSYITKNYGWEDLAKASNVRLANTYLTEEELIKQLKESIKDLGYIPTNDEYRGLNIKPTRSSIESMSLSWTQAMRKAGYKPYGQAVKIKDKICAEHNCYRQFTPHDESEIYCDSCYKALRQRIINQLKNIDKNSLENICQRLILTSSNQKSILNIFNGRIN
ncbi:hypothetical protein [Paenibacillus sp. FSL H3-0333]|uniref:hypothetical protein n=1 Tax=Paenibacillus sp. FSL H3-0333 TaxID=2921373 RepID=UPI0030F7AB14